MTKWLVSNLHSYNLSTADCIYISNNWLMLTTSGGQAAREVQIVYGTFEELKKLYEEVMDFLRGESGSVLDCDAFLKSIR